MPFIPRRFLIPIALLPILALLFTSAASVSARVPQSVWGTRPLLSYFALTQSLEEPFRAGAGLTSEQFTLVEQIAYREANDLHALYQRSQEIISGSAPLWWKRVLIYQLRYNQQVSAIIAESDAQLRQAVDPPVYWRILDWIEKRWPIEQKLHGSLIGQLNQNTSAASSAAAARTYRVYATRYDSKGRYTAALPDKCVKFTNGGSRICEDYGYKVGVRYEIFITYSKSVGVVVAEAGPWNIDDTYWAAWNDPTPRRMFADVGLGIPEAQAAYFSGYNGGKDQYGRKVTGPFGIDLAFEVSTDIGLKANKNDWVTVTFQWTQGWGSPGGSGKTPAPGATRLAGGTAQPVVPVAVSTPQADGSVIHVVQPGQTLWDIAAVYGVPLNEIYRLNNLEDKSIIWPGDQLLIRTAGVPATGEAFNATLAAPTHTPLILDSTGTAWAALAFGTQALETVRAQIYTAQTSTASVNQNQLTGMNPILLISIIILVLGGVLILVGSLVRHNP